MSIGTRWRLAATVLAAAVLVSACAHPAISLPSVAQPVITPQQARVTFLRLESERTVALRGENKAALAKIDTGEALANDDGEIDVGMAVRASQDVQGTPFTSVSMLVPRLTSYPAWFAALTWEPDQRTLDIVARRGPSAPWRLQFETLPMQGLPRVKQAAGYATASTLRRNLSSDLARYYENGLEQKPTRFVLPGPYTSRTVSSLLEERSSLQSSGWSVGSTYKAGLFASREGLALRGGGMLGIATYTWTISISASDGSCFWQDPRTSYWTSLGSRGSTSQLRYTREMSLPVIESKAGERVIGRDVEDIRADRHPC